VILSDDKGATDKSISTKLASCVVSLMSETRRRCDVRNLQGVNVRQLVAVRGTH